MAATAESAITLADLAPSERRWSFDECKAEIREWISRHVPRRGRVLDVGPGGGTYAKLLREERLGAI